MQQSRYRDKTIVITGASSGIGQGMALAFAAEGARVVVNYCRSKDKAEKIVAQITAEKGKAIAVQADLANLPDIQRLIDTAEQSFGPINVWVNNAGADILTGTGATLTRQEKLANLIDIDLIGTMNASWAIAEKMKEQGGTIINMSWDLAIHGFQGTNPQLFAAAKAGVLGFSRSLALSYAPQVRVNILAPGWIQTAFAEEDMTNEYYQARIKEIPIGRFGTPEDVANVALFLGSDDAAYITGEVININGGLV